ncbi:winged helix-turn-helix domain-containing protein [Natranaeroarchaeum sulfidigenes]|uniref:Putative transcriptional regulator n=1 Tax=Natranaeroarchaeum sulfidigenes TaxID=2784880 RepID=A0A897MVP2_9EURY|nr:winged helix-turn-helix domain-containing protein [Natranaeroarchaeum sulfidigenes]QSG02226.1 putative transcriptional regulator [Natranaeroarchaeum sulfidigenes]
MSSDDTTDPESPDDAQTNTHTDGEDSLLPEDGGKARDRLEEEADRAVEGFDQGIVDLLSWLLETETRARIYVYLRQNPGSTSEEVAEGTGLYPSTVREALAELHDEEKVTRSKRENEGAGNNPYEYDAMAPSDLVGSVAGQVQKELNTVFNMDTYLGRDDTEADKEPVTITVEDRSEEVDVEDSGVDDDGASSGDQAENSDEH